jgi:L-alanine-DL-glutamate epimerase-like enolase superfamily enzyme
MKITKISVFKKPLPYISGELEVGDRSADRGQLSDDLFNSTVVVIDTDAGISGCGESCPWGDSNLGGLPAMEGLAKALLGNDPRQLNKIEQVMDSAIEGHPYAKGPVDVACWDIFGKSAGVPVYMLLGGKLCDGAPLYRCVMEQSQEKILTEIEEYRAAGYKYFKLRVGINPESDIELIRTAANAAKPGEFVYADANGRWTLHDALQVVRAVDDLNVMIEQPCLTYEECLHVRARTNLSMKLDELVTDLSVAERMTQDLIADVACVKISRIGGLTKARRIRDYFVYHGIKVVCEDMWGAEIVSAAVSHFAASTPAELLFNTADLHTYNAESTGTSAPPTSNGRLYCSDAPGLGVEPDFESLGDPEAVYE